MMQTQDKAEIIANDEHSNYYLPHQVRTTYLSAPIRSLNHLFVKRA